MCDLCEKYAPVDGIDKYDSQLDPMVTGEFLEPNFAKQD
jgi:protein-ribulosamine 3-kinase